MAGRLGDGKSYEDTQQPRFKTQQMAADPTNSWGTPPGSLHFNHFRLGAVRHSQWPAGMANALHTSLACPPTHASSTGLLRMRVQASPVSPKHPCSGGSTQWDWEKTRKPEHFRRLLQENKQEDLPLRDPEKACSLKNSL